MSERVHSKWLALAVLCAGMLMVILDGSVVTVALPAIQTDLGLGAAGLTWIVNAYLLAFGGFLLLAGRMGDLLGRRRMFIAGLVVFTVASVLCGVSISPEMLIVSRFIQGIGGAMASAVSLGMIASIFTDPATRARAFGVVGFTAAGGASIGQVLGGVLTDALSWHWIFLINLPIGVVAVVAALRVLAPDTGLGLRSGADVLGAVLATSGVMLGVYAIVSTEQNGWFGTPTLISAAVALVLIVAFLFRQRVAATPLLPLRIFSSRNLSGANVVQLFAVAAAFGFQVLIALYMQRVLGYSPGLTGVVMLTVALSIALVSLFAAAPAIGRFGEKRVLIAGLGMIAVSQVLLVRLPVQGSYLTDLMPSMVLLGGFGLAITALTGLAMSPRRVEDTGLASGLFNTGQQVGAALGVAVLTSLAGGQTAALQAGGAAQAVALTDGFRLAFGVGAGLVLVGIVVAAAVIRPVTADAAAEQADAGQADAGQIDAGPDARSVESLAAEAEPMGAPRGR